MAHAEINYVAVAKILSKCNRTVILSWTTRRNNKTHQLYTAFHFTGPSHRVIYMYVESINIMRLTSLLQNVLSLHKGINSWNICSLSWKFRRRPPFRRSFLMVSIHVVLLLPTFLGCFFNASFKAILAGVSILRRNKCPNHQPWKSPFLLLSHF